MSERSAALWVLEKGVGGVKQHVGDPDGRAVPNMLLLSVTAPQ